MRTIKTGRIATSQAFEWVEMKTETEMKMVIKINIIPALAAAAALAIRLTGNKLFI